MNSQPPANPIRDLLVFFFGFGLGFSGTSAYLFAHTRNFLANAVHARGTVVAIEKTLGHKDALFPIVVFRTTTGAQKEFESRLPNQSRFPIGSRVDVLYDRRDPLNARIDTIVELWGSTFIIGVLGLTFIALGTTVLIKMPRGPRAARADPAAAPTL